MTEILVLEKPEEKLRRERERLLGELSVYGERLEDLKDTVDEIKEMIEYYDGAIENLGTDHAKQNSKTINEEIREISKMKNAGQYLDEIYFNREDLLERLWKEGYRYLARDEDGDLWSFRVKPKKEDDFWDTENDCHSTIVKNDNFPQVQWIDEEPTKISDLLATHENGGENGK